MTDAYDEEDPTWHAKGKMKDDEAVFEQYSTDVNLNTPNDPVTAGHALLWRRLARSGRDPERYLQALSPSDDTSTAGILIRVGEPPRSVAPSEEPARQTSEGQEAWIMKCKQAAVTLTSISARMRRYGVVEAAIMSILGMELTSAAYTKLSPEQYHPAV